MTPLILFITGASGTGKSTVYDNLKALNRTDLEVHDVDEDGVPEDRGYCWGKFRVEQLLYRAKEHVKQGKHSIICGISFPHDVVDGRYYTSKLNVHHVLLVCDKATIKARLKERLLSQGKKKGWKSLAESNAGVQLRMKRQVLSQRHHLIINTADTDAGTVVKMILAYIGGAS
jgi:predicted ABC-type ATPase